MGNALDVIDIRHARALSAETLESQWREERLVRAAAASVEQAVPAGVNPPGEPCDDGARFLGERYARPEHTARHPRLHVLGRPAGRERRHRTCGSRQNPAGDAPPLD